MNDEKSAFNSYFDSLMPEAQWPLPDIDRRQYPQLDYNTPWPQAPAKRQEGAVAAAVATHAFLLENASTGGTAKVRVHSGTINALDPVADGPFNAGDDPVIAVNVADGDTVFLELSLSYSTSTGIWTCTSFTIRVDTPIESPTTTLAFHPLGTVTVAANDVTAISDGVNGNIGWERCGKNVSGEYQDYWWAGP
jgi:hypothetical protein